MICVEIECLVQDVYFYKVDEEKKSLIEKGEIILLEEVKCNIGFFEQLGYLIKKLVWV